MIKKLLLLMGSLLILTGCVDNTPTLEEMDYERKEELYATLDKVNVGNSMNDIDSYSHIENVESFKTLTHLIDEKNDLSLYIGFDECPFCQAFSPKVNLIAEYYDITLYHINTNEISDEDYQLLRQTFEFDKVPMLIKIKDQKEIDRLDQFSSMEEIELTLNPA